MLILQPFKTDYNTLAPLSLLWQALFDVANAHLNFASIFQVNLTDFNILLLYLLGFFPLIYIIAEYS